MTANEHQESREITNDKNRSTLRKLLWALGILVVTPLALALMAGIVVAVRWWQEQRVAAADVAAEVALLETSGQPMTAKSLYAFHQLPADVPDTTDAWLAAQASIDPLTFNAAGSQLPYVGQGNKDLLRSEARGSQLAAAEQFLQAHDSTLQAILHAARQPGECRHPVKFEDGIHVDWKTVQGMRTLVRLLALNVRVRAYRGDASEAARSLGAMVAASNTISHQLTIVEQQVRMVTLVMALEEAEFLLNEIELTEEQLAAVQRKIAASDVEAGLTRGLIGERALGYQSFAELPNHAPLHVDCRKYLELMSQAIAASQQPFDGGHEQWKAVATEFAAEQAALPFWEKRKYVLTTNVVPSIGSAFGTATRTIAHRDAFVVGIAAERYRLKHGQFPAQIDELVPDFLQEVPNHPADGEPFNLVKGDGDLVIGRVVLRAKKMQSGPKNDRE